MSSGDREAAHVRAVRLWLMSMLDDAVVAAGCGDLDRHGMTVAEFNAPVVDCAATISRYAAAIGLEQPTADAATVQKGATR